MPTLKQLLGETFRASGGFSLPNCSKSSIRLDFSSGTGEYTAPSDGWLMVRAITTKELVVAFGVLQFYQSAQVSQNIAFTVPLRKGQTASLSWWTGYEGNDCWGFFVPCG